MKLDLNMSGLLSSDQVIKIFNDGDSQDEEYDTGEDFSLVADDDQTCDEEDNDECFDDQISLCATQENVS